MFFFCFVSLIYDQGSNFPIIPPLEDLQIVFHKKKYKRVNESSSSFQLDKFKSFEKTSDKKGIGYDPGTKSDSKEEVKSKVKEMAGITTMTMEEYKRRIRNENDPGLVAPEFPVAKNFELKGHILSMLKDIPFFGKDHEDAFRHIDEVLHKSNYVIIPNVSRDPVLLRMLPVTSEKSWQIFHF